MNTRNTHICLYGLSDKCWYTANKISCGFWLLIEFHEKCAGGITVTGMRAGCYPANNFLLKISVTQRIPMEVLGMSIAG